jgi:CRP-like cAMP-binding protein
MDCSLDASLHDFLRQIFSCSSEVAAGIGQRALDRRFPVKATILSEGRGTDLTFLMMMGRAQAVSHGLDGQLVLLHEYLRGDVFGAIGDSTSMTQRADVVAVEDVRVAAFSALDFLTLIETHGCVGLAVSRMLLRQLRASADRIVESTTLSAAGRVYAELLRLARLGDGHTLKPIPVLASLAVRVSSTRETVSRTISALERRGIIRREPDALVIVAPHRLEEMMV